MKSNGNNIIPTDLLGKWGYFVGENPVVCININEDGSGYLTVISDVKWAVNEKLLSFRNLNKDYPVAGSVQYSIIDGKLSFSEPLHGDAVKIFSNLMYPNLPNGLDKIMK